MTRTAAERLDALVDFIRLHQPETGAGAAEWRVFLRRVRGEAAAYGEACAEEELDRRSSESAIREQAGDAEMEAKRTEGA